MKRYMNFGGRFFNAGGAMPMNQLTEFNEGGRHEENGLGGIPQGINPEGQMNLVEEGETKFDAENYIFSDTLKVDKELAEAFNLNPKMVGKTFADASKMAGRKKSRREGDAIEEAANNRDLENLMEAQEAFKQKEIQEKLAEIDQLDPNALPALMGQGQPQGDPAMGGQMQEAPMDEQAMMEQQIMAEQQAGGGQPSPEEMAMMEQQQNMAMGQQEGMMRGGGALDYPNYGGLGRIKKAEGPMTEDEAQMIEAYKKHQETLNTIDRITEKPNYLVTGKPLAGDLLPLDTYREWWNMPRRRLNYVSKTGRDAPPEAEKLGGYLGDGKSSFGGGGYMSRSYAPGGFMGMNMANAGMMNTGAMGTSADLKECMCADGSTHTSCCQQGYEGGSQAGVATKDYQGMFRGRKLPFRHRRTLKKADVNLAQGEKVFEKGLTGSGGLRATSPANWANLDLSGYTQEQKDQILNSELLRKDPAAFSELNPDLLSKKDLKQVGKVKAALEWTPPAQEAGFSFTPSVPDDGSTRGGDGSGTLRGPGTGSTPVIRTDHNFTKLGKFAHNIQPWNWTRDKLVRSNPTKFAKWSGYRSGLNKFGGNLMQPANEMRGGGKLCYGCGGKMHPYGGRMSVPGVQHKYGSTLQTIGSTLDTVGNFLPPGFRQAADITGKLLNKWGESKEEDVKFGIGDIATAIGSGAVETIPGAEQVVEKVGDVAMQKNKEEELRKKQIILEDETHPDHARVKAEMEARANDPGLQKSKQYQTILGATAGLAGTFMNPGEATDATATITEAAPDAITDTVTDTTGVIGEGAGFGNWSDIDMGAPELPFGTGGRMGSNYLKNGGGLWANIHAKRKRIAAGSGESMRKPGSEGAPTAEALENSQNAMGGRLYYPGGYLFGPAGEMPPDPNEQQSDSDEFTYAYPDPTEALEQTPLQQASIYAPLVKNIYDATLAKTGDYVPDFVPSEYVQLDSSAAIQQEKQRSAGITAAAKAKGFNNPSILLALNQQLQGKISEIQAKYDEANAKFKQAAKTEDVKERRRLGDLKESLKMQLDEAKNLAANEAALQAKQIAESKTANKLALLYATMGAPDMGVNFRSNSKKASKLQKELEKLQKEIEELKKKK